MCGRFAQGFAIRVVAEQLERGEMGIDDIRDLDNHYPSYNVAPTTYQAVYRRERSHNQDHTSDAVHSPDQPATNADSNPEDTARAATQEPRPHDTTENGGKTRHILQGMKWGLIPFWTKRAPDSGSQLKTINCRDDSLLENRGMWNSMKGRKRCIVPVQGYYEWFKKSPKEKIPHFTRRKDGELLMLAGLYDSVQYEGAEERLWTFTIITTAANKELAWLHDRMPLILDPKTDAMTRWLDDDVWSQELVTLLRPYQGALECYAVKKEVGKVGNNSPDFIIPIDSKENKSNIANFFQKREQVSPARAAVKAEEVVKEEKLDKTVDGGNDTSNGQSENNAPMPESPPEAKPKREGNAILGEEDLPFRFIPSHLESRTLETIDVYTARIQPTDTSKVINFINTALRHDAEDLSHLKRIKSSGQGRATKRIKLEEDVVQKPSTLEILLCACASRSETELTDLLKEHNLEMTLETTAVSKYPPLTTKQLHEWRELWPLAWRVPAQRRVQMPQAELEECEKVMDSMLNSAALMATSPDMPITAIAWNPVTKTEVARASDLRQSSGHPLKHAIMELVAAVAAFEVMRRIEDPESEAQYLCSNLYIFVSHEPCTMCCMALLHSRVAKVFYAQKMEQTGGFESSYGIHWRSELNHRFIVFGGWKAERAQYIESETDPPADTAWSQQTVAKEVNDLETELYSFHPPRSYLHDEPESEDEVMTKQSPTPERVLLEPKSQPRRARPRLQKKVPRMTDFFKSKS